MAKPLKFWMSTNPNAFLKNITKGIKIFKKDWQFFSVGKPHF
jgi:hypothetical protein